MKFKAHGSFGELLQGRANFDGFEQAEDFLITLPIKLYSTATFTHTAKSTGITISPKNKPKLEQLFRLCIGNYQKNKSINNKILNGILNVKSDIPHGKGLAGSSADLLAALRCLCHQYNQQELSPDISYQLLCQIEPSDAIIFNTITACLHKQGIILKNYDFLAELSIVAINDGTMISTENYNKNIKFEGKEIYQYSELYSQFDQALEQKDLYTIGQICSKSAFMNQKRNPKKYLELLNQIAKEHQAMGIITAHSGSMSGILIESTKRDELSSIKKVLETHKLKPEVFSSLNEKP